MDSQQITDLGDTVRQILPVLSGKYDVAMDFNSENNYARVALLNNGSPLYLNLDTLSETGTLNPEIGMVDYGIFDLHSYLFLKKDEPNIVTAGQLIFDFGRQYFSAVDELSKSGHLGNIGDNQDYRTIMDGIREFYFFE